MHLPKIMMARLIFYIILMEPQHLIHLKILFKWTCIIIEYINIKMLEEFFKIGLNKIMLKMDYRYHQIFQIRFSFAIMTFIIYSRQISLSIIPIILPLYLIKELKYYYIKDKLIQMLLLLEF